MKRAIGRECLLFLFFLLLTLALTWPLVRVLDTGTSDLGDPLLNDWILNWDLTAATHGHLHDIYQAPMFVPAKDPLAFSENLFGIAVVMLPFFLAGLKPLVVYNLAVILGFAFCGYGASVLARVATGSLAAGVVSGVLYAFLSFHLDHLAHLQILWAGWLPLILAALLVYWRNPTTRNAIWVGGALLMNGLCNVHYLLFGTTTAALTITFLGITHWKKSPVFWTRLLLSFVVAMLLLVPVLLPYRTVSELYQMKRSADTATWGSANWADWLLPAPRSKTYLPWMDMAKWQNERAIFPGLLTYILSFAGFLLWPRDPSEKKERPRWLLHSLDALIVVALIVWYVAHESADIWAVVLLALVLVRLHLRWPLAIASPGKLPMPFRAAIVWIAAGMIGSLGMHAFFHRFLFEYVTAFQSIRVPARWASIAYVGFAVTNAYGVVALSRRRAAIAWLFVILAIWEMRPLLRYELALADIDPSYAWLRDTPAAAPVLEMPVDMENAPYLYLYGATMHHRALVNGVSGFEPPQHMKIKDLSLEKKLTPALTAAIAATGCRTIIVHDDWLRDQSERVHAWLAAELAAGRLRFLRRFDHRIGGDYVFAVTANAPHPEALQAPHERNPIGLFPEEDLAQMLRGQPTYISRTFGILDFPTAWTTVPGRAMTINGWALSPNTVRSVDVLLQSGTVRKRAQLVRRADIAAKFPWYPGEMEGFTITLPKRPKGVPKYTDVQVEVTDGMGNKTRLPDVCFTW